MRLDLELAAVVGGLRGQSLLVGDRQWIDVQYRLVSVSAS
jgi:hypothetical protein